VSDRETIDTAPETAGRASPMLGQCSCTALRKATRRVSQLYDSVLEPCGLRTTQRAILNHIFRAGTPPLGQLATALVMDRGALTHNLKPLERDGLLEIKADPQDRRNRLVAMTAKGRKKLAQSEALWVAAQRRFEAAFGVANAKSLSDFLGGITSEEFPAAFAANYLDISADDAQSAI
jgi:DNA-binding MarR family transcriptional regulator